MKKAFWIAAAAIAACIGFAFWQYPKADTYVGPVPSDRILIAYYSQSGHTEAVAKSVQEKTGGRLYRIRTNIQYPRSAPAMQSQVKAEYNERLRPLLSEAMPDMGQYDVVFLGFPNWYNAPPCCSAYLFRAGVVARKGHRAVCDLRAERLGQQFGSYPRRRSGRFFSRRAGCRSCLPKPPSLS